MPEVPPSAAIACAVLLAAAAAGCATPHADEPLHSPAALERRPPPASAPAPATATAAPALSSGRLTLARCLALADEHSRRVALAEARVLAARDKARASYAGVLPTVESGARFAARDSDPEFVFGGNQVQTGDRNVPYAHVSASVPIYDFGRSWGKIDADEGRAEVARLDALRARQDVALDATSAYLGVLARERALDVAEESARAVSRALDETRVALAQGLVAPHEVLALEVDLAARRQDAIRGASDVEVAKASLNRALGLEVTAPLELEDVLERPPWTGAFEAALEAAMDARPDLAALRRSVEVAGDDWRAARGAVLPRVYAFGEVDYAGDSFVVHQTWLLGGVAIDVPIFEGGASLANIDAAEVAIRAARLLHDERVDDVVLEVKEAYLRARDAAARIPVARGAVGAAEEGFRVARNRLLRGLSTSAETLLEEERLTKARSAYHQALYDYHEAFARLTHACGGDPPR